MRWEGERGLDGGSEEEDDPLPWGPKQGDGDDKTSLLSDRKWWVS